MGRNKTRTRNSIRQRVRHVGFVEVKSVLQVNERIIVDDAVKGTDEDCISHICIINGSYVTTDKDLSGTVEQIVAGALQIGQSIGQDITGSAFRQSAAQILNMRNSVVEHERIGQATQFGSIRSARDDGLRGGCGSKLSGRKTINGYFAKVSLDVGQGIAAGTCNHGPH